MPVKVATITTSDTVRRTIYIGVNYDACAGNSVICKRTMTVKVATITASGTARRTYV